MFQLPALFLVGVLSAAPVQPPQGPWLTEDQERTCQAYAAVAARASLISNMGATHFEVFLDAFTIGDDSSDEIAGKPMNNNLRAVVAVVIHQVLASELPPGAAARQIYTACGEALKEQDEGEDSSSPLDLDDTI